MRPSDLDCGGHSCQFARSKTGMRHNGPCTCVQELIDEVARLRGALERIEKYGDKGIHGNDGICPYGCDTPHIAQAALDGGKVVSEQTRRL